jgi:hypothetical protein
MKKVVLALEETKRSTEQSRKLKNKLKSMWECFLW